jgi:hypothetical protein
VNHHEPDYNESLFSDVIRNFRRYFHQRFGVECNLTGKCIFYHWRQSLCFDPDEGLTEDDMAIRNMYLDQFPTETEVPAFVD